MAGFWTDLGLHVRFLGETGMTNEDVEIKVRDCNRAFGGWGWEITELLGHYFSGTLSFPVLAPVPDLLEKAKKAIFWHPFENVRASSQSDLSDNIGDKGTTLYYGAFTPIKRELIELMGWRSLWNAIESEIPGVHKSRIEWLVLEGMKKSGIRADDALWGCIHSNILMTIVCAVGYLIAKRDQESFKPLLALWRSGNLPIGFDRDNTLVVLCKE